MRFLVWSATTAWSAKHPKDRFLIRFKLEDPSRLLGPVGLALLHSGATSFGVQSMDELEVSSQAVSSNESLLMTMNREIKEPRRVGLRVTSGRAKSASLLFANQTHALLLVSQTVLLLSPEHEDPLEGVPEAMVAVGNAVGSSKVFSLPPVASVALVSSSFSLQLGPAFVKLFQVIDILGRFYFAPIERSNIMNYFLLKANQLSDMVDFNDDIIMRLQPGQPNNSYNKLSKARQDRWILRSQSVMGLLYLCVRVLSVALGWVGLVDKRLSRLAKCVSRTIGHLQVFLLQMMFVDFVFDSTFCLMGYWIAPYMDLKFFANKLVGLLLLSDCSLFLAQVVRLAWTERVYGKDRSRMLQLTVFDGIEVRRRDLLTARLVNPLFIARMFFFQVAIVTTQNAPVLGTWMLLVLQTASSLHLFFTAMLFDPFDSFIGGTERAAYELCTFTFILSNALIRLDAYSVYVDYLIILFAVVSVVAQFLNAIKSAASYLKDRCALLRKRKLVLQAAERASSDHKANPPTNPLHKKIIERNPHQRTAKQFSLILPTDQSVRKTMFVTSLRFQPIVRLSDSARRSLRL